MMNLKYRLKLGICLIENVDISECDSAEGM